MARSRGEVLGVAGLVTGVATLASPWLALGLLIISLILYGYASWGAMLEERSEANELAAIKARLKAGTRIQDFLGTLAVELELEAPWRLTLYVLSPSGWRRVARDSNFKPYADSGRTVLPADQGTLAWAAKFGNADQLLDLPDPGEEWDKYLRFQEGRAVPRDVTERLRMRSRAYACVVARVHDVSGTSIDVGLVAESEKPLGVKPGLVERHVGPNLLSLIHRVVELDPSYGRVTGGPTDRTSDLS
ncbi:hypothetical protein [Cellulomonas sp. SLBN-39]|uniref:hypothetical protein n=1 Tax=Cellulomonas sp. SLBN-39 TaxID=2768446 RepID=UPI00115443F1|nr:hypothetical protein [Cellulomonas sp. SLBN-39]